MIARMHLLQGKLRNSTDNGETSIMRYPFATHKFLSVLRFAIVERQIVLWTKINVRIQSADNSPKTLFRKVCCMKVCSDMIDFENLNMFQYRLMSNQHDYGCSQSTRGYRPFEASSMWLRAHSTTALTTLNRCFQALKHLAGFAELSSYALIPRSHSTLFKIRYLTPLAHRYSCFAFSPSLLWYSRALMYEKGQLLHGQFNPQLELV